MKNFMKKFLFVFIVLNTFVLQADILFYYMAGVLPSIVATSNSAPTADIGGDQDIYVNNVLDIRAVVHDTDGDKMSYQWLYGLKDSAKMKNGGNELDFSHLFDVVGLYVVEFTVEDEHGAYSTEQIEVNVTEDPNSPTQFNFTDEEGIDIASWFSSTVTVSGFDAGVEADISSSGYPVENDSYFLVNGQNNVSKVKNGDVVKVGHKSSSQYSTTLGTTITIGSISDTFSTTTKTSDSTKIPLIVGVPNTRGNIHELYSYTPQLSTDYNNFAPATEPFTIENKPSWASFDVDTGKLSGTPVVEGLHRDVKVSAYGDNGMDSIVFDITITEDQPPYINGYGHSLETPNLDFAFSDNPDWRSKVTEVWMSACYESTAVLLSLADYTFTEGNLTLHSSTSSNVVLHIPTWGGGELTVKATDYDNSFALVDYIADGQYAIKASLSAYNNIKLNEGNLNGSVLDVNLSNYLEFSDNTLDSANFVLAWDIPNSVSIDSIIYVNSTSAQLHIAYDGTDFDDNITLYIDIMQEELNICQGASTNSINIEAIVEIPKNILKTGVIQNFIIGDDASTNKGQDRSYAYTDNVDSNPINQDIVRDNITRLQWQDNIVVTYDEYSSYVGDDNWTKANNYCEALSLHDYDDWRLPNNEELLTLVNYGKFDLAVDNIFNNFGAITEHPNSYGYWSSVELSGDNRYAWVIGFNDGELHYSGKASQFNAKCIRGNLTPNQFRRDTNIVYDTSTNLKWQDNIKVKVDTFAGAIDYCDNLELGNETNWRLPNINELLTITDFSDETYNIDEIFEQISSWYYYTSTRSATDSTEPWFVLFNNGGGTYQIVEGDYYVRCVSDDNPPAHPTAWLSILNGTDSDGDTDHVTVGVELNGTTFADNSILLIQQNGVVGASGGYVYVDDTHAYIVENIENLTQDEPLSWTMHESETLFGQKITTDTIIIHSEGTVTDPDGTVTVGDLMWEDTAHTKSQSDEDLLTWQEAYDYCENLVLGEFTNWRLSHSTMNAGQDEDRGAEVISIRVEAVDDTNNTIIEGFTPVYQSEFITTWTDEIVNEGLYMAMIFQYFVENGDAFDESSELNIRCVRDIE